MLLTLAEAVRGYDLIVLGAAVQRPGSGLFGDVVDAVLRETPCTALIFQAARWRDQGVELKRILVPTAGTGSDLRVVEFALALARGTSADVLREGSFIAGARWSRSCVPPTARWPCCWARHSDEARVGHCGRAGTGAGRAAGRGP